MNVNKENTVKTVKSKKIEKDIETPPSFQALQNSKKKKST